MVTVRTVCVQSTATLDYSLRTLQRTQLKECTSIYNSRPDLITFPAQTLMPLFGSLLCACFRAQETAVNAHPLPPMESPAVLYPKIKHPAASYQGASSLMCRQHLPDCLSPFIVLCFSLQMGENLGAVLVVQDKAQE